MTAAPAAVKEEAAEGTTREDSMDVDVAVDINEDGESEYETDSDSDRFGSGVQLYPPCLG